MLLYRGSNTDVRKIDLSLCRPFKDFGRGFYTTQLKAQAEKMAIRVARMYGGSPIVNVFEISDDFIENKDLNIIDFGDIPSAEWASFVMNNRNSKFSDIKSANCNLDCKYDIVIGPIANDRMSLLFQQFEDELISFENLINGLTYKDITNQYSFHTVRATELLKKVGLL